MRKFVKRSFFILVIVCLLLEVAGAQEPRLHSPTLSRQNSGTTNRLIAISPVDSKTVWASGSNGTFVVTTNGGQTWRVGVVAGAETLQFRDVQAVSARVAYLLSIGDHPSDFRIYKTENG